MTSDKDKGDGAYRDRSSWRGRSHLKSHQECKGTVESCVNLMCNIFQSKPQISEKTSKTTIPYILKVANTSRKSLTPTSPYIRNFPHCASPPHAATVQLTASVQYTRHTHMHMNRLVLAFIKAHALLRICWPQVSCLPTTTSTTLSFYHVVFCPPMFH